MNETPNEPYIIEDGASASAQNGVRAHFTSAWLSMRANLTATLSTLITIALSLMVLGGVSLFGHNLNRTVSALEAQAEVAAFLSPEANGEVLAAQAKNIAGVKKATFVTAEEVLVEMTRDQPATAQAARTIGNPFPPTLRLEVSDPGQNRNIASVVSDLDGVESVEFGAGYVDKAAKALSALRTLSVALVLALLAGAGFSILNAVQVSMYTRRNEIEVMRLLGATRGFVQTPHLIEGAALGGAGAFLAGALLLPVSLNLTERAVSILPALPLQTATQPLLIGWLVLIGLGLLIGFIAALVASGRYLKELE